MVSDLDVLKQIMVKDFDNFSDHAVSFTDMHLFKSYLTYRELQTDNGSKIHLS